MPVVISVTELRAFRPGLDEATARALIDNTLARAFRLAPCLEAEDFPYAEAARAVILDAILRRVEAGAGAVQSETSGPHSRTFFGSADARALFWPSEITELQALCFDASAVGSGGLPAYSFPPVDVPALFAYPLNRC